MADFSVSVVISTFNRAQHLRNALTSLRDLDYPRYEIVVVNGPSTDATESVLGEWQSQIKIAQCSEANLSMSRNIGLSVAAGDITAFIDDDAVAHPRWLKNLVSWFHDERVAGVGGYTIDNTGVKFQARKTVCDRFGNAVFVPDWFDERSLCFPGTPYYPSLLGTNAVFRTSALREIGGFDEVFAYYLDETDVCLRIVDQGYRILYEPSALVYHQFAASHTRDANRVPRTLYPSAVSKSYFIMHHGAPSNFGRASDELKKYETEIAGHNRWMAEHGEISADHRFSLDQDLLWGISEGVRLAQTRGAGPVSKPKTAPAPEAFLPYEAAAGRLRICMVSQNYPPDTDAGIGRWTATVAAALACRGHRVHVITRAWREPESLRYESNIWLHRCAPQDEAAAAFAARYCIPLHLAAWCARVYREVQLVKRSGLDLVSFPIWDLEGLACLDDSDIATSVSLHTTYALALPFKPDWLERPLYKALNVDKVIAAERDCLGRAPLLLGNSEAIVDDIETNYGLALKSRCIVVPHGTEDLLDGVDTRPQKHSGFAVLFVGRFELRKGFDIALDAARRALHADPTISFEFIGGEMDAEASRMVVELGLSRLMHEGRLRFSGVQTREALESSYRACDLVLMPSRYESFGLVAIEAMAAGKPVIALDSSGVREVVEDSVSGVLVPPDDTASARIALALCQLAGDKAARERLARGARRRFEEGFTVDVMATGIEAAFRRAVAEARTQCRG